MSGRRGSFVARAVDEFHEHPNARSGGTAGWGLRRVLHEEEHAELVQELEGLEALVALSGYVDDGPVERACRERIARELADVVYVAYGTARALGIDLDEALVEVHRAAMDKVRAGVKREDGKIVKPAGFVAPDMSGAVKR